MKKLQNTDSRVIDAIVLYKSGMAVDPICQRLKMDSTTLRRLLIEEGVLRTRSDAAQRGKASWIIKHDALDTLTPESMYWIGFLYADGHIEKNRPRIMLTLADVDQEHLEKFSNFFGCGIIQVKGSGKYKDSIYHRCGFSSKQIYDRLRSLGFTNRKTWDIQVDERLKNSRDFWRGCIDGDGWICKKKKYGGTVGLSGHENTLRSFIKYLEVMGLKTNTNPVKDKRRQFLWKMDLQGKQQVEKVLDLLYKDSTVYLNRKFEKYKELTNKNQQNDETTRLHSISK